MAGADVGDCVAARQRQRCPADATVTITGTAADTGGDSRRRRSLGRRRRHLAAARRAAARGRYSWQTGGPRTVNIRSRAVDDSGNLEQPSLGVSVDRRSRRRRRVRARSGRRPGRRASGRTADPSAGGARTRFRSDIGGFITAIRFYKSSADVGPHVGNLWTEGGGLLASVTFTGETASGWQEVALPSPVAIAANTTYVVSYHTGLGQLHRERRLLRARAASTTAPPRAAGRRGRLRTASIATARRGFPDQTFASSNYWVDVVMATSRSGPIPRRRRSRSSRRSNGAVGIVDRRDGDAPRSART